jgi:Spy/CpxP family protein refolding chaperone
MKRIWFLAFALSLGINSGLLYVTLSHRGEEWTAERRPGARDQEGGASGTGRNQTSRRPGDPESIILGHLDRMTRDLNLDDRQRSAIGALHEKLLPRIIAERHDMDSLRKEVTSQYAQSTINPSEFRALVHEVSRAQTRIDSLVTEAMLGEAAVLTYGQRQRYVQESPWGHPLAPPDRPPDEQQGRREEGPPRPPSGGLSPEPPGRPPQPPPR